MANVESNMQVIDCGNGHRVLHLSINGGDECKMPINSVSAIIKEKEAIGGSVVIYAPKVAFVVCVNNCTREVNRVYDELVKLVWGGSD